MAVYPMIQLGNPMLRQPSTPCVDPTSSEVAEIIGHLRDTHANNQTKGQCFALAAPQIGFPQRIILVQYDDIDIELINPRFERWSRDEDQRYESCFSFSGLWGLVQRPRSVVVVAWNRQGEEIRIEASGTLARIIQHDMDHLDGLIWLDRNPDLHSLCTTAEYEKRYTSR